MTEYDIGAAFDEIEQELISSLIRNLDHHRAQELEEGYDWSMWQVEQLKELEIYRKQNRSKFKKRFFLINKSIPGIIKEARKRGEMEQEREILLAIKNGFKGYHKVGSKLQAQFFKTNSRKLDALIQATINDFKRAEHAILRMADDQYRKIIYNAQVYANTGAGTYDKAVDMAIKDLISAGLNCVEYSNGARHTLPDYADMAIRTAGKRAYLTGEGEKRQEWGIHTVIINKRGNPCSLCLPFVGKVLIDDVWSGGTPQDGSYPLMSSAIAAGLYHPRCKDSHTTYFEGVSSPPKEKFTQAELNGIMQKQKNEQRRRYAERQANKYQRLYRGSLSAENHKAYYKKYQKWAAIAGKQVEYSTENDIIELLPAAEKEHIPKEKFTLYALNFEKDPNKARAFKEALGYQAENADKLIENIRSHIGEFKAVDKGNNGYGQRYEVLMTLTGENQKTANVKTAWIIDNGKKEPRLTSAYVTSKKRDGDI